MILYYNFSKKLLKSLIYIALIGFFAIRISSNDFFDYKILKTVRVFTKGYNTQTMTGRDRLWDYGLTAISERPILGYGYGSNEAAIAKVTNIPGRKIRVHNTYLKVWMELGIFGLILLLSIFLSHAFLLRNLSNKLMLKNDHLFYSLVFSKYVSWVGMLIFAVFGWSAYLNKSMWLFIVNTFLIKKILSDEKTKTKMILK
jgi:O-antigen ligase